MADKGINFTKIEYKLISVNFDVTKLESIKFNLEVFDDLVFNHVQDSKLYLNYTRNVSFDKRNGCGIKVVFKVIAEMGNKAIEYFNKDNEKIAKFIEKNKLEISNDSRVGSDASLIIAQLTSNLDSGALILPPYFIVHKANHSKGEKND